MSDPMPLEGIRVLEFAHAMAGPFCGGLLGDFGAEVIKIERAGSGDSLRRMGPVGAESLWFTVNGRNKRSVEVDLADPSDNKYVKDLVASSDAIVENYRPGTLEKYGLGWDDVEKVNPRVVMLRISGFGRGGPYSNRPGFGKIAESFSGATNVTGYKDTPPVHPGYSLADLTTGMYGAWGIMLALFERERSGKGQMIDLGLYDGLFRMLEWQIPFFEKLGIDATRNGASFPFEGAFVTEICPASDGAFVVVSAATTSTIENLIAFLRGEGVYALENSNSVEASAALRRWVAKREAGDAIARLTEVGVVTDRVYRPSDLAADPHVNARGSLVAVETEDYGTVRMPAPVPNLMRTPGRIRAAAPKLGQDNGKIDLKGGQA
ncbi:CaiB/BaiF CoA transferase family protein [Streptomyces sp. NPDC005531]|uniref:CaiB/BaiF CoA transferase family protein n=1 Tax=Streptomyces sp. NPDC005531 TaxID=3364722 RepID=UPI00369F4F83